MPRGTLLLIRRDSPAEWRAVPDDRMDLGLVGVVEIPYGRERVLIACKRAISFHRELVEPYGERGEVLGVPSEEEDPLPPGLEAPAGYTLEKAGPYYRLYDPDGNQVGGKALHRQPMETLIGEINGSLG